MTYDHEGGSRDSPALIDPRPLTWRHDPAKRTKFDFATASREFAPRILPFSGTPGVAVLLDTGGAIRATGERAPLD
jgi:hypothetical protein